MSTLENLAAAVRVVAADTRDGLADPAMTTDEAIALTRDEMSLDDVETLTSSRDSNGAPWMPADVAAAYRVVLGADETSIREATSEVYRAEVAAESSDDAEGPAPDEARWRPGDDDDDADDEVVSVEVDADAAVACAAAMAAATQAAAEANAAGGDVAAYVVLEDVMAACDEDAY